MEHSPHILVVGGRGFIGGFIVAALRRKGWRARILARPQGRSLAPDDVSGNLANMLQPADWADALGGVTAVVNAAGILRESRRQRFDVIHYQAPLALAQACAERGIRFIQISALGNIEDGGFIESKHRFDAALLKLPVPAVVLRPSVVYARQGAYGGTALLRALASIPWRQPLPGRAQWALQPVCAQDLAELVAVACQRGAPGVYEVGCPEPITLAHYQRLWRNWLGIPGSGVWHIPLPVVNLSVALGEWLGRGPLNQTIWRMLKRGNRTTAGAYPRLQANFQVPLRSLDQVLAAQPSQTQDRWAAQLYFLVPCLKWSLALLWLWSAMVGLVTPPSDILALVQGNWLEHFFPVVTARASALLDMFLGVGLVALARPRWVITAMLVSVLMYLVAFSSAVPGAWMAPLGGLAKNLVLLPALAIAWVLVERR